jgi:hypothetical protein
VVSYNSKAKARWPRSTVRGSGQFAVLTCAFMHPSAHSMCYSDVYLFDSKQAAEEFKTSLDNKSAWQCDAHTKGLCKGNHELVDLG